MRKPNRRMRRHQRDLDGGLVFSWRVPGDSLTRTAIGVLVATTLVAGAASLVRVRIPFSPGTVRESARVLILDPNDPDAKDLLDWARFHSPFPDRWEPGSEHVLNAMMREITTGLEERVRYEPQLRPLRMAEVSLPLPGLTGDVPPPMPRPVLDDPGNGVRVAPTGVEVRSEAAGPLAGRWGTRVMPWHDQDRAAHIGRNAAFMVGVDREGRVVFCLVMDGLGEELTPRIERWLRKQVVDPIPNQEKRVWDVVRVRVRATGRKERGKSR